MLNTAAPAAQQIIPYVDGKAVTYTKLDSGTGSGNFANSTLYMMSRAGTDLCGAGDLDEVALYTTALSAATIAKHYAGIVVSGEEGAEGGGEEPPHEEEPGGEEEEPGPGPGGTGQSYTDAVLASPGLLDYWRMGEAAGPTLADSVGSSPATASGGPASASPGGVPGETGTRGQIRRHRRRRQRLPPPRRQDRDHGRVLDEVEQLRQRRRPGDGVHAQLQQHPGGFLVDPNSSYGTSPSRSGSAPRATSPSSPAPRPAPGTTTPSCSTPRPRRRSRSCPTWMACRSPTPRPKTAAAPAPSRTRRSPSCRVAARRCSAPAASQDVAIFDRALSGAAISGHYASNGASGRPVASFKAPTTAKVGETVQFDASASKDLDGTIVKYEWDLDGNGSYETDTGTTPSASRSYASAASINVGLRVTDNTGNTGSAARTLTVEGSGGGSGANYQQSVLGTAGLVDYWRLDESSGSVFADSAGTSPASMLGAPTLGVPGGVPGDANTAARFDGVDDSAGAALQLAGKSAITVEFWMKWNSYSNDDRLAMEYTPNYNDNAGGFVVDPNSSYGNFAVGLGQGSSRNLSLFARPSAGAWHHYAFVLDTTAPASEQVVPYVDGKAGRLHQGRERHRRARLRQRDADADVAGRQRPLRRRRPRRRLDLRPAADRGHDRRSLRRHRRQPAAQRRPSAPRPASKSVRKRNSTAAASSDPDGSVSRYEWDLDGNGTFETSTGSNPSASRSYSSAGPVAVGLRVTDDAGASGIASHTVTVEPGSGGGEEEGGGETPSTAYRDAVLASPSLLDYWRLGEKSGSTLADSAGSATLSALGEPTLGVPGAVAGDADTAVRFDGVNDAATVPLTLAGRSAITVEFWMKWTAWANDDTLAMEYTPNFNDNPGGFLVDPNSSYGRFAVGIGQGSSRNDSLFARPSGRRLAPLRLRPRHHGTGL